MEENVLEEEKIENYIETKEIEGGKTKVNIKGGAKTVKIKGGVHTLKISSPVETIEAFAGTRDIIIKNKVDKLIIKGGISNIIVHNINDTVVKYIEIIGGKHDITIYSTVEEINIKGGITKVTCNFINSKLNKIKSVGGQRDFYLNENTDQATKENEGGTCNIHKTDIVPEPPDYQDQVLEHEIPKTVLNKTLEEKCNICLSELKKDESVYFLQCLHKFHCTCLKEWVKKSKTCPNCKYELKNKLA